jgi:hypothetical protein
MRLMHAHEMHVYEVHANRVHACCGGACVYFCYLRDSGLYVHESCCPGDQRYLPTYVGCRRFWYSPPIKYGS